MVIGPIIETRENGTTIQEDISLDELLKLPISKTIRLTWEHDGQTYWIENPKGLRSQAVDGREFVAVIFNNDPDPHCMFLCDAEAKPVWFAPLKLRDGSEISYGWFDTRPEDSTAIVGAIINVLNSYFGPQFRVNLDLKCGKILDIFEYR